MPYLCTRIECGYIWDARGRTDKKVRCPRCHSCKTIYVRHLTLKSIKNFIKRSKQYIKGQSKKKIYRTVADIDGNITFSFLISGKHRVRYEEQINWLKTKDFSQKEAQKIITILRTYFKKHIWYSGEEIKPEIEDIKLPPPPPPIRPTRPIIPEKPLHCWGKWIGDRHCQRKCDQRKSCKKEYKYRQYKKTEMNNCHAD